MNLNIRFKGFDGSQAVKDHLNERSQKLGKFLPPTTTLNATLEDEKVRKTAEIVIRYKGSDFVAKCTTENLTSSIDDAIDKLTRQLSRAKSKATNRQTNPDKEVII